MPHKKTIATETDAHKMQSFARLGRLKEAPASIGGEYFTILPNNTKKLVQKEKIKQSLLSGE